MALMLGYYSIDESAIRERFREWSSEGYGYLAVVNEVLEDVYTASVSEKLYPIRKDHVCEDLESIYNGIGRNTVRRVIELTGDFNSARTGGLEILPLADVIAVERNQAVEEYKKSIQQHPDNRTFLHRLAEWRPGYISLGKRS